MRQAQGTVLNLHDTTEIDYTGLTSLSDELGQIGNGSHRAFLCHNSLAVIAQTARCWACPTRSCIAVLRPTGPSPARHVARRTTARAAFGPKPAKRSVQPPRGGSGLTFAIDDVIHLNI